VPRAAAGPEPMKWFDALQKVVDTTDTLLDKVR
jgi:hypothetical protein